MIVSHYITKYVENETRYVEAWIQFDILASLSTSISDCSRNSNTEKGNRND